MIVGVWTLAIAGCGNELQGPEQDTEANNPAIPRYTVADLNWGYRFNDVYTFKMNVNNLNNNVHREIIGGAELGGQIILNLSMNLQ